MTSISPSQLADHLECPRRRYFRSFLRLPEPPSIDKTKRDLGTALHTIAERWLRADDQGRGPDGNPIELFPEGWDCGKDRDGREWRLSFSDSRLVKQLVQEAIEAGVLRRLPRREIEAVMRREVLPGVYMNGRIDQRNDEVIEDHKTTGGRRWALGPERLRQDPKMLCYAADQLFRQTGEAPIRLRLNYFLKKPDGGPNVWASEVAVPAEEISDFWAKIVVPSTREMVEFESIPEARWAEVEGPRTSDACSAYGGCPFAQVCSGQCRPSDLRNRPAKILRARGKNQMSVFEKARQRKLGAAPQETNQTPSTETQAPQEATEVAETVAPATPQVTTPPWAIAECRACGGTGINSKGDPCAACAHIAARTGRPTPDQFEITKTESGLTWTTKSIESDRNVDISDSSADVSDQKPAAEEGEEAPKRKRGRPRKNPETAAPPTIDRSVGFDLFINAVPINQPYVDLAAVMAQEGAELAKAHKVESFYALDAFKRRDALCQMASEVAKSFPTGTIVVSIGSSPDQKAYADAFRPLARTVVIGTI